MGSNWSGERLETSVFNEATVEHLHRYAIAIDYVKGKEVLDIACGEGYGTSLLAKYAGKIFGVDIDIQAVEKAKAKYKKHNIEFRHGKAEMIPFGDQSFDVATCFETLEHTSDHRKVLNELRRVLKPGGLLILSTPDKKNYSDLPGYQNPYHVKELYKEELKQILVATFEYNFILHQRLFLASVALADHDSRLKIYKGDYEGITSSHELNPLYYIAFASDTPIPEPASSVFESDLVLQTAIKMHEHQIKSTLTYQIGHKLLLPLKWIRKKLNSKSHS